MTSVETECFDDSIQRLSVSEFGVDGAETKSYWIIGTDFRSLLRRTDGRFPVGQLVPDMSASCPTWFLCRSFLQILTNPDEIAKDFGRKK
jgi:hypothetical protein